MGQRNKKENPSLNLTLNVPNKRFQRSCEKKERVRNGLNKQKKKKENSKCTRTLIFHTISRLFL